MTLQETPRAGRVHISIFGRRNSGKSTLINAITGHETAVTSPIPGTTTDPVYKSMEINGLGPCVLIDTAGFDDEGILGELRVERTNDIVNKTDIAIVVFEQNDISFERVWIQKLREKEIPIVTVINQIGNNNIISLKTQIEELNFVPIVLSAKEKIGIPILIDALRRTLPPDWESDLLGGLVKENDSVLLVMPQDIQAPKGRLILPQVQVTRALLDKGCIITSVTADKLEIGLASLKQPPSLIITDSQIFPQVYAKKPTESRLTSFSILMAMNKGNIETFVTGAKAIDNLTEDSYVLIAEACTHAPLEEDIGREKIPRLLRKKIGNKLKIDHVSGSDFPDELSKYDLIIHCGACMFNRRYVLSRLEKATKAQIPITNYGVVLAHLAGILDKAVIMTL